LGRGPTTPPWVKVARQVGTLWPWYERVFSMCCVADADGQPCSISRSAQVCSDSGNVSNFEVVLL
jgi:hypothetical protein